MTEMEDQKRAMLVGRKAFHRFRTANLPSNSGKSGTEMRQLLDDTAVIGGDDR
jgi:hypothetical protein